MPRGSLNRTVLALVAVCALAGVVLIFEVYQATTVGRPGSALTYPLLRADLDSGLHRSMEGSTLRDAIVASPLSLTLQTAGRAVDVAFDSLIIRDTAAIPSLRDGGFLNDEVQRFNTSQRRRLEQVAHGIGPGPDHGLVDLRELENPSVFRTDVRPGAAFGDEDTVVLAHQAVTSGMFVRSPFDEMRSIMVTSRTAPRANALISSSGISVLSGNGITPGEYGCPFTTSGEVVSVKCRAPNSRRPEILLSIDTAGENGRLRVFSDDIVRYDGSRVTTASPADVRRGGLVLFPASRMKSPGGGRRPAAEASAIERTAAGAFGGVQWVNGRLEWRSSPEWKTPFLGQLTSGNGFAGAPDLIDNSIIALSLDEKLTREVQQGLDEFVNNRPEANVTYATVVIADARSGEILATAESGQAAPGQGSWLLRATNFGSAVKPILATAVLSVFPELGSLEVYDPGDSVTSLWGRPFNKALATGCKDDGWIDLRKFLACSSNLYAASLVSIGLQNAKNSRVKWEAGVTEPFRIGGKTVSGERPVLPVNRAGRIDPDSVTGSALAYGLDSLFQLSASIDYALTQNGGRDSSVWSGLHYYGGPLVRTPAGLWPETSRVGLASRGETATLREAAAMAIGAAENRMTPLAILQAFDRIITDRNVSLTFAPAGNTPPMSFSLGLSRTNWYPKILEGLRDVSRPGGTVAGLGDPLQGIAGTKTRFFAKTGTLDADADVRRRTVVDTVPEEGLRVTESRVVRVTIPPVVIKSLLFGVGQSPDSGLSHLKCGVTGAIYFRLHKKPGNVPPLAADFARDELWQVIRTNWNRLHPCSSSEIKTTTAEVARTAALGNPKLPATRRAFPVTGNVNSPATRRASSAHGNGSSPVTRRTSSARTRQPQSALSGKKRP